MIRTAKVTDTAIYQRVIKVDQLRAGGVVANIAKCGQGATETASYEIQRQQIIDGRLISMAYHWIDPLVAVAKQLDFLKRLWDRLPAAFLWLDFEQWWANWGSWSQAIQKKIQWAAVSTLSPARISDAGEALAEGCQAAGLPVGNYSSPGFIKTYAPQSVRWLNKYPFWLAQYGNQPKQATAMSWSDLDAKWLPNYPLSIPAGIDPERVVGHQFTGDRILLPGMYSNALGARSAADVSLFDAGFLASLGAIPQPEPVKTDPVLYQVITTASAGLRIRNGIGGDQLGMLPLNSQVAIYEENGGWGRIEQPMAGWISLAWTKKI